MVLSAVQDTIGFLGAGLLQDPGNLSREVRGTAREAGSNSHPRRARVPLHLFDPLEDAEVLAQFRHVPCRAGDLVLWDHRIPHANSRAHTGAHPRQVVYVGLIPRVRVNLDYVREQRVSFKVVGCRQTSGKHKERTCGNTALTDSPIWGGI